MLSNSLKKSHTAASGLQEVHDKMLRQFNINNTEDVETAEKLQTYLQYFKKVFYNPQDFATKDPLLSALGLDEKVIVAMRQRFQEVLQVTKKYNQIFRSQHSWYQGRKDFDDIVEGEINALLQVVAERATGIKNINLGQKIVGGESAMVNIPEEISEELIESLSASFSEKLSKKQISKLIKEIQVSARSGKTDVQGYSKELLATVKISQEFEEFIKLFSSVNFSIKNYKGNGNYEIHLGKTAPFKAIYGALTELGYNFQDALHIYSHSRASYQKRKNVISRNNDIFHLRFMYELRGSGLYQIIDTGKSKLGNVDYLIYNDPMSDKIFVKSTKQMIQEIITNKGLKITDPWRGIYVSKTSFY